MARITLDNTGTGNELKVGANPDDGTGNPLRTGGQRIKQNLADLNTMLADLYKLPNVINGLDPTGVADANNNATTGIINAFLIALSAAGGGIAYIPAGTYKITVYISIPSNVVLRGAGKGTTKLVTTAGATVADPVSASWIAFVGVHDASVQDLTLDISATTAGGDGITFCPATSVSAMPNDLTIAGTFTVGEQLYQAASGAYGTIIYNPAAHTHVMLYDIHGTFTTATAAVGSQSGTSATPSVVLANPASYRCSAINCEVIGRAFRDQYLIWNRNCHDIEIRGCTIEGNGVEAPVETTGHYAYDTTGVDGHGIEIFGGFNCKVLNNTVRNMPASGINLAALGTTCISVENSLISGNTIEKCSTGIQISADYQNSTAVQVKDCIVSNNHIVASWRHGVKIGHETTGTYIGYNNFMFTGNTVDNSGSKSSATYCNFCLRVAGVSTNITAVNSVISNNTFVGGGGRAAGALYNSPFFIDTANGWDISGNVFDSNADNTYMTYSVKINSCLNIRFVKNKITKPAKFALNVNASTGTHIYGNWFIGPGTISDISLIEMNTHTNTSFVNNVIDGGGSTNPTIFGNNNGTGYETYGNVFVGSTKGYYATIVPWSAETGTTQTHGFGSYSPGNGGANFTITNGKIWATSRIAVTQTAGTLLAFKVLTADGSFTLTPSAVFAGSASYTYQIIN